MREIPLKEVEATLSMVLDDLRHSGEVIITRQGEKAAVIISWDEWKRVSEVPSFARLLMSSPLEDGDLADRDRAPPRSADV